MVIDGREFIELVVYFWGELFNISEKFILYLVGGLLIFKEEEIDFIL